MSKSVYAEIAPGIPLPVTSSGIYTYRIPPALTTEVSLRQVVKVPFGKRTVSGVVTSIHQRSVPYATKPLRVRAGLASLLTAEQLQFGIWLATTMQGGLGYTLRLFVPSHVRPVPENKTDSDSDHPAIVLIEKDFATRLKLIMRQAEAIIADTRQVLVIVPEIFMLDRWQHMANNSHHLKIAFVHAGVTGKKLQAVANEVQAGTISVVVGTQKALYLPYRCLGLVVLEEESVATHKLWDQYPRLDNHYGVEQLTRLHGAKLLYASPSPSLQIMHRVAHKHMKILHEQPLEAKVQVISSTFADREAKHILPQEGLWRIRTWLSENQHVLVVHNARGMWQVLVCRSCQQPVQCPQCGVALTVHGAGQEKLLCHHCGFTQPIPITCEECQGKKLQVLGAGMEKIAQVLKSHFSDRFQVVTFAAKSAALPNIAHDQGVLIVATSAIFSALAVGNLTIDRAVLLWPERSLLYPDYRSEERTRVLLSRIQELLPSRRRVVVLTRQPQLVDRALVTPWSKWANRQLAERNRLRYPPLVDVIKLTIRDNDASRARAKAKIIRTQLNERLANAPSSPTIYIQGPFTSFVKRQRGQAEYHVLLRGDLSRLTPLYQGLAVDVVDLAPERIL